MWPRSHRTAYGGDMATHDLAMRARDLVRIHDAVLYGPRRPRAPGRGRALVDPRAEPRDRPRWPQRPRPAAALGRRGAPSYVAALTGDRRDPGAAAQRRRCLELPGRGRRPDGVVLWRSGSPRVKRQADGLGFTDGATWTEATVGTNAIGTALTEAAPVQLFSAEHFENARSPGTAPPPPSTIRSTARCSASSSGGPALTLHPAIEALVTASVRLAEARLWRHHEARLDQLRRTAELALRRERTAARGRRPGWVAAHQGVAVRDRVEAPQPDRALAVPGLGLCLPERLRGGWLIRPSASAHGLTAVLDLGTSPATLEVRGGESPWRVALTPRHAELLAAIAAAGRQAWSAGRLSQALYGDNQRQVTVRAEISRMRRVLGALLATNPYRIGEGVSLSVVGAAVR
uniref:Hypothetical regulator Fis-type n=1 Tax=Nocardioides simplex TaxID=2045 RepID=Q3KZ35_NOCSI|nr:hypothetical regulator Fis-type [Pimelobacter simplex]